MSKYDHGYRGVEELRASDEPLPLRRVDLHQLAPRGPVRRLVARLVTGALPVVTRAFRRIAPVQRLAGLRWVTRSEDILAVIDDPAAFEVPFGREMADLTGGVSFALGDDGALHARQRAAMDHAWREIDLADVRERARTVAEALLADAGGRIDVTRELFPHVAARSAAEVLGLPVVDMPAFIDAALACNSMLFADPYGDPRVRREGLLGARMLRPVLREGVAEALAGRGSGVLARAAAWYRENGVAHDVARRDLEALASGLVVGYAPTTGLFAAGIVRTLAKRPAAFAAAREAAITMRARTVDHAGATDGGAADARRAFDATVLELSRFHPALMPGQFRVRTQAPLRSDPGGRLARIRPGETVLVATAATVSDPARVARPGRFDATRALHRQDPSADAAYALMFGRGMHHCIGKHVAIALVAETLAALLAQPGVRFEGRRPRLPMIGPVPGSLHMRWTPAAGQHRQTSITAAIPLASDANAEDVRAVLRDLQEDGDLRAGLDRTGVVHFASFNLPLLGRRGRERPHLLVELNVDGTTETALDRIWSEVGDVLERRLDRHLSDRPATWRDRLRRGPVAGPSPNLRRRILRHMARPHRWPWGDTGLNFAGGSEFSVHQLARERALAERLDRLVREESAKPGEGARGVAQASRLVARARAVARAEGFEDLMHRVRSRGPRFARDETRTWRDFLVRYATQPLFTGAAALFLVLTGVALVVGLPKGAAGLTLYVVAWLAPLLLLATAGAGLALWLRREEDGARPDGSAAPLSHLRALREAEERPGHAQSHITAVSTLAPGPLRRLTYALALHLVGALVRFWFRPGFMTDFSTIHYARWIRIAGTDQIVFQSNYDGSWEAYLEAFVTKVHSGMTLVWSNAIGFPRSRWLVRGGARDGDRFKRWVRGQQIPTPFWYSRFPDLTLPQILSNALIRDGLVRARDVGEHRAWLKLFGSVPRGGFETGEVQMLAFNGMGRHEGATCLPVRFERPAAARRWLGRLARERVDDAGLADVNEMGAALRVGDTHARDAALFVAFAAGGLEALGLHGDGACGLDAFPAAFLDGMGRRATILGDADAEPLWLGAGAGGGTDVAGGDAPFTANDDGAFQGDNAGAFQAHGVLLLYTLHRDTHARHLEHLLADIAQHGMVAGPAIDMSRGEGQPAWLGSFGFREGASQPVMHGTRRAAKGTHPPHDLVTPGEFILGYPDTRGFVPPAIAVRPDPAARRTLPLGEPPATDLPEETSGPAAGAASTANTEPFPHFGDPTRGDTHDLGRNGSFLVIRQLETDDAAWDRFVDRSAATLIETVDENAELGCALAAPPRTVGRRQRPAEVCRPLVEDYVRAKTIGRWPDGSSLLRNPVVSATAAMRMSGHDALWRQLRGGGKAHAALRRKLETVWSAHALAWDDAAWDDCLAAARALDLDTGAMWPSTDGRDLSENHFLFGRDDPQGLHCPIGSHIRRSNPRDTPNPDNPHQIAINNRHRLLRRGRLYRSGGNGEGGGGAGGTMFMCLNADIERQFEFVQQTWVDSPRFGGLRHAPDPVVSAHGPEDRFSIPHTESLSVLPLQEPDGAKAGGTKAGGAKAGCPAKQRFVTFRGGGYFFLPSLAALHYLAQPDRGGADEPVARDEEAPAPRLREEAPPLEMAEAL